MADISETMAQEAKARQAQMDAGALKLLRAAKTRQDETANWPSAADGPRSALKGAAWVARDELRFSRRRAREILWQERSLEAAIARLEGK